MLKLLKYVLLSLILMSCMNSSNQSNLAPLNVELVYPKGLPETGQWNIYTNKSSIFLISNQKESGGNVARVYQSTDYGNSWILLFQKTGEITGFSSFNSIIICATYSKSKEFKLEWSNDSGKKWSLVYSGKGMINTINSVSPNDWLIGGRIDNREIFLKTNNKGGSWSEVEYFKNHLIYNNSLLIEGNIVYGIMHSTFDMKTLDLFQYNPLTNKFSSLRIEDGATLTSFNKSPFGISVCAHLEDGRYFTYLFEKGQLGSPRELKSKGDVAIENVYGDISSNFVIIQNHNKNEHFNSYTVSYGNGSEIKKIEKLDSKLILSFSFNGAVYIIANRVIYRIS